MMDFLGYKQFEFPLDGKRGDLVDDKYPPEDRRGFDPFMCGTDSRDDFYYLTERGSEIGDYYRTNSIEDPEDKGRDLYRIEPCDADGCRCGWDAFVVELVTVRHGRGKISGFNRVNIPLEKSDDE